MTCRRGRAISSNFTRFFWWSRATVVVLLLVSARDVVAAATVFQKPSEMTLRPPQPPLAWNHSKEDILHLTTEAIAQSKEHFDQISALEPQDCNFTSVFLAIAYEEAHFAAFLIPLTFYAHISPSEGVRNSSTTARALIKDYVTNTAKRLDLYQVKVYAEKSIKESDAWNKLTAEDKRLVEKLILEGKHAGLALPDEERAGLVTFQRELAQVTLEIDQNIREENGTISFTEDKLKGIPRNVISGYEKHTKDSIQMYDVTLKDGDVSRILQLAENPETRKRTKEAREARLAVNTPLLYKELDLRHKIAQTLSYNNWADYAADVAMIKNAKDINTFLNDFESKLRPVALKEREILLAMKRAEHKEKGLPYDGELYVWDVNYYSTKRYIQQNVDFNRTLFTEHFPVSTVIPAMLGIYQELFGVHFEEMKGSMTWHPDVQLFAVWKKDAADASSFVGYCYLDLFSREPKSPEVTFQTLVPGYDKPDGSRSYPVTVTVAAIPQPQQGKPALLTYSSMLTLFGELGVTFYGLLSNTKYSRFHGISVSTAFLEATIQVFENLCWDPEVLRKLSNHYLTNKPLSDELVNVLVKSRYPSLGLAALRQLFFAKFDVMVHTSSVTINSTELWRSLRENTTLVNSGEAASGFGSFSRISNLGAQYYQYLYSAAVASDIYATVFKGNPLDPARGEKFVQAIFRPGGSRDELDSVQALLGRPPNSVAFIQERAGLLPVKQNVHL